MTPPFEIPKRADQFAPAKCRTGGRRLHGEGAAATVLTIGMTPEDALWLGRIEEPHRFSFVPLRGSDDAADPERCRPRAFVAAAVAEARNLACPPAGIVAFDDYPASLLAHAIAQALGLPGPSLESALLCNHKVWSRMLQRDVAPEAVPRFQIIDPRRDYAPSDIELRFPFWLKPVKSSLSYLGFRVGTFADFQRIRALARTALPAYTAAFDEMVDISSITPPPGAAEVRGDWLIAEELLGGKQCTLEAYVQGGRMRMLGVADSVRLRNRVSFKRFDYPSELPAAIQREMGSIAERVMHRFGFDDGLFNIEFFLDTQRRRPMIIEINPRFSPQFSDLYAKVEGRFSHQHVVELAIGRVPAPMRRQGLHRIAASFVLRSPVDCIVRRTPSADEIARVRAIWPDAHINVLVRPGDRLSDLCQDSFTFRYALVHLGAPNRTEMHARFKRACEMLPFELQPVAD